MVRERGFTLIELMIVMAIIATLLTIAVPRYYASLDRSKEAVLKENLYQMRDAIGKYYADKGKYPASLEALVEDGYLRAVPVDPMTKSAETWVAQYEEPKLDETPPESDGEAEPGIMDVHSGSDLVGSNGQPYSEW